MRVVAGSARGRRLKAPSGTTTRPTSDRVREAIFASLVSMGAVEGARVVDVFAGTGAMGIEALSRGAASVVFVERDRSAVAAIRANVEATGFDGAGVSVVQSDVLRWVEGAGPFDLALIDPPYAFDDWPALLERLDARVVVCESGGVLDLGPGWHVLRSKRYGTTVVTVAQASTDPSDTAPATGASEQPS